MVQFRSQCFWRRIRGGTPEKSHGRHGSRLSDEARTTRRSSLRGSVDDTEVIPPMRRYRLKSTSNAFGAAPNRSRLATGRVRSTADTPKSFASGRAATTGICGRDGGGSSAERILNPRSSTAATEEKLKTEIRSSREIPQSAFSIQSRRVGARHYPRSATAATVAATALPRVTGTLLAFSGERAGTHVVRRGA